MILGTSQRLNILIKPLRPHHTLYISRWLPDQEVKSVKYFGLIVDIPLPGMNKQVGQVTSLQCWLAKKSCHGQTLINECYIFDYPCTYPWYITKIKYT